MSYLSLDDYSKKWIFTHHSMPVPEADLVNIKPMTQARSAALWKTHISSLSPDADRFSSSDWPAKSGSWQEQTDWMASWESDQPELPELVDDYIDWQDDVTVYFFYDKYQVIETKWLTFKRHWKNFLFYDDGPILIGKKRRQALWFSSDGLVKLGVKGDVSA